MNAFVISDLVSLSFHDCIDNAVVTPPKVIHSRLMDAFVITSLVFLFIRVRIHDDVLPKGGLLDVDGRIRGHEPRVFFCSLSYR